MFIPLSCLQIIRIISAVTTLQEHPRLVRGCESYLQRIKLILTLTLTPPELFRLECFRLLVIHPMAVESDQDAAPSMVSTIHSPGEGGLSRRMMMRESEKSAGKEGSWIGPAENRPLHPGPHALTCPAGMPTAIYRPAGQQSSPGF